MLRRLRIADQLVNGFTGKQLAGQMNLLRGVHSERFVLDGVTTIREDSAYTPVPSSRMEISLCWNRRHKTSRPAESLYRARILDAVQLALRLTTRKRLNLLLVAAARGRPLRLRSSLLARRALYFLALCLVFNLGGIRHCKFLIPQKSSAPGHRNRAAHTYNFYRISHLI